MKVNNAATLFGLLLLMTAGGYMFSPADAAHWDGAKGNSDAIVQIIGEGPVGTEQSDEGGTMWVRVHD